MNPGDSIKTSKLIRSQKTGIVLPRQGTYISAIENLGRKMFLVNFGVAGEEYLFPNEIATDRSESFEAESLPVATMDVECARRAA